MYAHSSDLEMVLTDS